MSTKSFLSLATCLVFLLTIGKLFPAEPEGLAKEEEIHSLFLSKDDVFASTPKGIFKASLKDKKWEPIPMPDSMPRAGEFGKTADPGDTIYYNASGKNPKIKDGKDRGLYVSKNRGKDWDFVTNEHVLHYLFAQPDETLYAIVPKEIKISEEEKKGAQMLWISEKPDEEGKYTVSLQRAMISEDAGKTWHSISKGLPSGMQFCSIFQNPDKKELVCLSGCLIRMYVLSAKDKSYEWEMTREWEWQAKHESDKTFMGKSYGAGTVYHTCRATLSNYFRYPFGEDTQISPFLFSAKQSAAARKGEALNVEIEIKFLDDEKKLCLLLHDTEESHGAFGFWSLKLICPDGKRLRIPTLYSTLGTVEERLREFNGRERVRKEVIGSSCLKLFELSSEKQYKRQLNLAELFDFSSPGKYLVQLCYDNSWMPIAREKGEWGGFFTSEVFEVTILEANDMEK